MKKFTPIFFILTACASVTSPTGGPKDETPPELIESYPANNQKNFKGNTLELSFSEMIKLKDPKEEILIIPSPGKETKFIVRKNKLFIEPQNPWQENTTYSLNFRDGVQDLNEGNPAENLRIAFSTGPVIDSLSIAGTVHETFSEKIPDKITVALYQSDTFNIYNHTPIYFTKSNKEGRFNLQNLKPGTYYIYAFDDKNKNLKVESKTERFGFRSQPILLSNNTDSISLSLIRIDARPVQLTSVRHTEKTSRVRFNKGLDSVKVVSEKPTRYSYGDNTSELIFYHDLNPSDSIKATLTAIDSIGQKIDTTIFVKRSDTKMPQEIFAIREIKETYNHQARNYTHQVSYNKPLASITPDSIYIRFDSLRKEPVPLRNFLIDTIRHTLTLQIKNIPADTSKSTSRNKFPLALIYGKGAFISTAQDTSKRITKEIKFIKDEESGLVSIKVETTQPHFIIQLVTTDDKIVDEVKNVKEYTFRFVKPQEYKLRFIIDKNGNGKWDPGNFTTQTEPERVQYYKSEEGKYSFPIRANWEYGPLLIKF
ncbi:MAG: Ig-like domain-containing protein [Cyclobacteriaceae bacterium]|nr:Ig-like domain-containing protein [Cyclobacteriaceae bacterium]